MVPWASCFSDFKLFWIILPESGELFGLVFKLFCRLTLTPSDRTVYFGGGGVSILLLALLFIIYLFKNNSQINISNKISSCQLAISPRKLQRRALHIQGNPVKGLEQYF